jgi:hypothetical protein
MCRSLASSSTWSLERLDALAAEISAYFKHSVVPGLLAASGRRDSILQSLEGSSSQPASRRSNAPGASTPSLSSAAHLNFASDELPPTIDDAVWAEVSKALPRDHIPHGASAFASSSPSSSAAPAVPGQQQDLEQQQDEQQDEQQQGASPAGASTHIDQLVASLSEQQVQKLMQQYPVQALSAVNSVMFDRHGYKAGNRCAPVCSRDHPAVLTLAPAAPCTVFMHHGCICICTVCRHASGSVPGSTALPCTPDPHSCSPAAGMACPSSRSCLQ